MLDKRVITAELKNIFKLLSACFDIKALVEILSKSKKEKGYHVNWKAALMDLIEGKPPKREGYPNLKEDFEKIDVNTLFAKIVGNVTKEKDIHYAIGWVFNSLFIPESFKDERETKKESLLKYLSEKKEETKDFGVSDITKLLSSRIKKESLYYLQEHPLREQTTKEIKKDPTLTPYETHKPTLSPDEISPEEVSPGYHLPFGLTPEEIKKITKLEELTWDKRYDQLKENLLSYANKHAPEIVKKILKIKLEEDPGISTEDLAKASQITTESLETINSTKIKKLVKDWAKNLAEKGDERDKEVYETMEDWGLLKEDKGFKKSTGILNYLNLLKNRIARKDVENRFASELDKIIYSLEKNFNVRGLK